MVPRIVLSEEGAATDRPSCGATPSTSAAKVEQTIFKLTRTPDILLAAVKKGAVDRGARNSTAFLDFVSGVSAVDFQFSAKVLEEEVAVQRAAASNSDSNISTRSPRGAVPPPPELLFARARNYTGTTAQNDHLHEHQQLRDSCTSSPHVQLVDQSTRYRQLDVWIANMSGSGKVEPVLRVSHS